MTLPVPDTSPAMLRRFLVIRIGARRRIHGETEAQAAKRLSRIVRDDSGVTVRQYEAALAGKADRETLAKVWRGLGVETEA